MYQEYNIGDCGTRECLAHERSWCANFLECLIPYIVLELHNVLCDPIIINYTCNLKYIFIIKFKTKMVDIRDVIVSKAAVHGLRCANCVPFLVK